MMDNNWLQGNTLGGKEKYFWWLYDGEKITIKRKIKNNPDCITQLSNNQVDMLMLYIKQSGRTPLANSMTKIEDGTEKDGIGKYIYNDIIKDKRVAQSASQLVSIFHRINVLHYNGKKRNMEFWINNMNWKEIILSFMKQLNEDIN
ncbi:hypothetical protein [Clostridium sp. CF012]|uniref:hypothetical protein n=1 Tax=Clostridium sp. CF012 TaxID=2843319 RepID=UPI001C0AA2E3|nr:hypothetical protein [Clostridium sp. CF012]MBU3144608.1 hypothetical protein [Clostridium sp. CF012]